MDCLTRRVFLQYLDKLPQIYPRLTPELPQIYPRLSIDSLVKASQTQV